MLNNHCNVFRGGSRVFPGGGRTPKMGAIRPPWSPIQSFNLTYWYFGPNFCHYGTDFGPKLALFMTKIRNFLIKYQCFGPWP